MFNPSDILKTKQVLSSVTTPNEKENFHSFMDNINNAIYNKAQYDLTDTKEKESFIENYIEEFIFCLYNSPDFQIEILDISKDILLSRENNRYFYCIKKYNNKNFAFSENNRQMAKKIYKNSNNGIACLYVFTPPNTQPIFLVNFAYSEDSNERPVLLYKKVICDFIELKKITCLEDFRRVIADCLRFYDKNKK